MDQPSEQFTIGAPTILAFLQFLFGILASKLKAFSIDEAIYEKKRAEYKERRVEDLSLILQDIFRRSNTDIPLRGEGNNSEDLLAKLVKNIFKYGSITTTLDRHSSQFSITYQLLFSVSTFALIVSVLSFLFPNLSELLIIIICCFFIIQILCFWVLRYFVVRLDRLIKHD